MKNKVLIVNAMLVVALGVSQLTIASYKERLTTEKELQQLAMNNLEEMDNIISKKDSIIQSLGAELSELEAQIQEEKNIFMVASETYGIDYKLLVAIAQHETGNFTSKLWVENKNAGGMIDGRGGFQKFNSVEEGVMEMARNLKRNYYNYGLTTIEQIQPKYCPSVDGGCSNWVKNVRYFYNRV